jgi:hypothetical protein
VDSRCALLKGHALSMRPAVPNGDEERWRTSDESAAAEDGSLEGR